MSPQDKLRALPVCTSNIVFLKKLGILNDGTKKSIINIVIFILIQISTIVHISLGIYYKSQDLMLHEIVENLHYLVHVVSAIVMSFAMFYGSDKLIWLDEKVTSGIYIYPQGFTPQEIHLRTEAQRRVTSVSKALIAIPLSGILLMYFRRFFQKQYKYPLFNVDGWYPFELIWPTYPIAFAYQFIWLIPATMTWISTLCIFIALSEHLVSHLKIVNFWFTNSYKGNFMKEEFSDNIKNCIAHHSILTKYISVLQEFMSFIMLWAGINSAFFLCTLGFLLTDKETPIIYKLVYLEAFLANICFPLTFCWYGQKIYDECRNTTDAVYEMNWYELPPSLRKNLLFIMQRGHNAWILKGGGVLPFSMLTFKEILLSTYSYINMLAAAKNV